MPVFLGKARSNETTKHIVTSVQVTDGYAHDYTYFNPLVDNTAKAGFKLARGKRGQGLSRRVKHARHTPAWRDPLNSIQITLSAGFTRQLWS